MAMISSGIIFSQETDDAQCQLLRKGQIRRLARWQHIRCVALLMFDYQSGGHGEMGSFYHSNMIWFFGLAAWGFGTLIGLLRAWRWARISTLVFSGLLAAFGIVRVVAFLRVPAGNISGGMLLAARILPTLLFVIPIVIAYRWLVFFGRTEVKAYFGRTKTEAN
jgi:hypothetical protein